MTLSEDFFRGLLEATPGYATIYFVEGHTLRRALFSEGISSLSGYSMEELQQQGYDEKLALIAEEDRRYFMARLKNCLEDGKELDCTFRMVHKGGQTSWIRGYGKNLGQMDGQTVVFFTFQKSAVAQEHLDLVNRIPVGMGIYTLEKGRPSLLYVNDGYYDMLGLKREDRLDFYGKNIMNVVHPDDRKGLMQVIMNGVRDTGQFSTMVRVMVADKQDYRWLQLDGRAIEDKKNMECFYVAFSNVDELQRTTQALMKSQASLQSALAAGDQLCFEYDPLLHVADGYMEKNIFGLSPHVEDYPESLIALGGFHPDDVATVRDTIRRIDEGEDEVHCEVRVKLGDSFRWYACHFHMYLDQWKGYPVAVCNMVDISAQMESLSSYQNHLDTVMRLNPNSISTFRMNITQNTCSRGSSQYWSITKLQSTGTVDAFFSAAELMIENQDERHAFREMFRRENIVKAFESGQRLLTLEHRYLLEPGSTEWIETSLDLVRNPSTEDIEGVLYTKDINSQKISGLIMHEVLERDYRNVVVLYADRSEYFSFDNENKEYCVHKNRFWSEGVQEIIRLAKVADRPMMLRKLNQEHVMKMLDTRDRYTLAFEVHGTASQRKRYEVFFYYIDRKDKMILSAVHDITDSALLEQLSYEAQHDLLTGLFNRKKTFAICEELLQNHPDQQMAICHFDIQRFRLYNSFFGEAAGDILLQDLAKLFTELSKDYEYGAYGRIEADVFCMMFPYHEEILEKHRRAIHDMLERYRKDFLLEAYCGIYRIEDNHMPVEAMFSRATIAAKNNKKKQLQYVSFYDISMEEKLLQEQKIAKDMQTALEEEQFQVYIQPKFILNTGLPYGGEALVRWIHPEKGLIMPGQFIPLFESNGFIAKLDQYMWEHVCRLLRKWILEGKDPAPVSVNVSRVSMYSPKTVPFLIQLVERYQVPANLLNLELTESAYMDDPEEIKNSLRELQSHGFQIMMDDFGSGYSSLNTLRELPVDFLKVDMKFLASISQDERSKILLTSVIQMAAALKVPVITEGVETEEQRLFLHEVGCEYAQGFLYARPMPVTAYERLISK